jgi:hypothetical protein
MPLTINLKRPAPRQHLTSVLDVMMFGKHRDCTVEDVLHDEPGYFDWLLKNEIITATDEMERIIDDAILERMDVDARHASAMRSLDHWSASADWEDIPY